MQVNNKNHVNHYILLSLKIPFIVLFIVNYRHAAGNIWSAATQFKLNCVSSTAFQLASAQLKSYVNLWA